jgi:Family of unknown function (DUF6152)
MLKDQEVSFMRARLTAGAVVAAGIMLLLSPSPVRAHHAFAAEFDDKKPVKFMDATVTKVELINPHSWIYVDVKQPDGTVENWAIEAGSPNVLLRRGITRNSLKAGDKIVVDGYQAKDGSHRANGRDLKLPNGQQLFLGSQGTGAPYEVQRPGVDTEK